MNVLAIIQLIAAIFQAGATLTPQLVKLIQAIETSINEAPGSEQHKQAVEVLQKFTNGVPAA